MSLILEALKKSEAERRLGQAPGLLSPAPRIARRHIAPWLLVPAALLALVAAVATAWWLGRSGGPQPLATPEPGATGTVAAVPAPDPALAPATAQDPPAPLRLPETARRDVAVEAPAPPAAPARTAAQEARPAAAAPAEATPAATAATEPSATPPRAGVASAAPPHQPAPAPVQAQATAAPAEPALPSLRELPAAERDALPPLAVTMHVYAEQPANRFALIDGRRRVEGDKLADGLVLEEIRRDGVVLNLRGRRFLLPRPG